MSLTQAHGRRNSTIGFLSERCWSNWGKMYSYWALKAKNSFVSSQSQICKWVGGPHTYPTGDSSNGPREVSMTREERGVQVWFRSGSCSSSRRVVGSVDSIDQRLDKRIDGPLPEAGCAASLSYQGQLLFGLNAWFSLHAQMIGLFL